MGVGVSILLIAAGAVLKWAVHVENSSVDVNTVGVILMAVGGVGLAWALAISSAMPWRRDAGARHVHQP
jgi:hypothetical protein